MLHFPSPAPGSRQSTSAHRPKVDFSSVSAVRAALERGILRAVNAKDEFGEYPLHGAVAAGAGNVEVCNFLVKKGVLVDAARSSDGKTALHVAVENGHDDACALLLASGATAAVEDGIRYETPLHAAANRGSVKMCKMLLAHKADVHAANMPHHTALYAAAFRGHKDVCACLLDAGSHINACANMGNSPLFTAITAGNTDVCLLLIERGADLKHRDTFMAYTALNLAAQHGCLEVCASLLSHGAEVNAVTRDHLIPLHNALHTGRLAIAKLLLKHGARVHASKKNGGHSTALEAALGSNNSTHLAEICDMLLAVGADIHALSSKGTPLLHEAVAQGCVEGCAWLLAAGAPINALAGGVSAITAATAHPKDKTSAAMCGMLIEAGADLYARDVKLPAARDCALQVAAAKGHRAASQLLFAHGGYTGMGRAAKLTMPDIAAQLPRYTGAVRKAGWQRRRSAVAAFALHQASMSGCVAAFKVPGGAFNAVCHVCEGVPERGSVRQCSRCHTVAYCSVVCQKLDWDEHKPACKKAT